MEYRKRTRRIDRAYGAVYLRRSNGTLDQLGQSWDGHDLSVADFWKKQRRVDGSLPPSDFDIDQIFRNPGIITTHDPDSVFQFRGYAMMAGHTPGTPLLPEWGSQGWIEENIRFTQDLLAQTNPFRPEYSVPVAIKEFVELASLFKLVGKSFIEFGANAYLNYRFGWKAFVRDVTTLATMSVQIERRLKEFDSLGKKGDLRRRVKLHSNSANGGGKNWVMHSTYGAYVFADTIWTSKYDVWGSVRWRRTGAYRDYDFYIDKLDRVLDVLYDTGKMDFQTAWELIPFSWLFDYFIDVSGYLTASLQSDVVEPYDICIMRHLEVTDRFVPYQDHPSRTYTVGKYRRIRKQRVVWNKGSFPAVTVGQIFGSSQIAVIFALLGKFRTKIID